MSLTTQCTVCAKSIKEEGEKVMCFGPCGMIKHLKCSDEIDKLGLKAMDSNRGLKYLCHGCRKQQMSYNNVLEKCQEILEKFIESVNAFRYEVQEKMLELHKTVSETIKCETQTVVEQVKQCKELNSKAIEKHTETCLENVSKNKSPTIPRRSLRTRKRLRTDDVVVNETENRVQPIEPIEVITSSATFADVLKRNSSNHASPIVKQNRGLVIIVKPKAVSQTARQTK